MIGRSKHQKQDMNTQKPFFIEINPLYTDKLSPPLDCSKLPPKLEYRPNLAEILTDLVNEQAHNHIKRGMLQQRHIETAISRNYFNIDDGNVDGAKLFPWLWRWHFERTYETAKVTAEQLLRAVSMGYAFRPVYKNNWRKADNFLEASHICLDFDSGDVTLQAHQKNPLAIGAASFAYTSPSHMKDGKGHRNRLVFITDRPITNAKSYAKAVTAIQRVYGYELDQSGKDAGRYWYGSTDCEKWTPFNRIPLERIAVIVGRIPTPKQKQKNRQPFVMRGGNSQADIWEKAISKILLNVESAADGEKHRTLTANAYALGGWVAADRIDQSSALDRLLEAVSNMTAVKDMQLAKRTAKQCFMSGMKNPVSA